MKKTAFIIVSVWAVLSGTAQTLSRDLTTCGADVLPSRTTTKPVHFESKGNPLFSHLYTADPAVLVEGDTLWLFTGHDMKPTKEVDASKNGGYVMEDWQVFSTTDMLHWTQYPTPLRIEDFAWADSHQAYAGHVAKRNGKYYWYVSTNWCGIGVAVSDKITGPYKDAIGHPMLTMKDCPDSQHNWACIDPAIFIDDDNTPYIIWGNRECYIARLKDNMVELDGTVHRIHITDDHPFTEAPWLHKRNGKYYLTYASEWPEKIAYAISDNIFGPYETQTVISETPLPSETTHPAIVEFRNKWIFFSHNGALPDGGSYSRSVIAEPLYYNSDGTIRFIPSTKSGVTIQNENDYKAYLMVYHKDQDHGLHMAISHDGYTWTALNNDKPVVSGDTIATQHGIRDPHIFRGPDGNFYLSMTDLHIYGKSEGYRDTEWERDGNLYGWGNNKGLVLMKSRDLIHWTHTNIDFSQLPAQESMNWQEVGCVWAPETVYDEEKRQMMIHFTSRQGNGVNAIYYAYVNNDYTALTTQPQLLVEAPGRDFTIIDSDIIRVGDTYHLFYVSHEHAPTPKHATAQNITGPYTFDEVYQDGEPMAHEAPNCWKRLGTDIYVVMFDNYHRSPMNFGFVETKDFLNYHFIGYFDDPVCPMKRTNFSEQKHGVVTYITEKEACLLEEFWKKDCSTE